MKKHSTLVGILLSCTLFVGITTGCVRLNPINNPDPSIIVIPKDFDWKTVREVNCTVNVSSVSGIADNMIRVIKIFNSPNLSDDALLVSGAAKPSAPFVVKISLATAIPAVYVQEILPDGSKNVKTIDIAGTSIVVSFTTSATSGASILNKSQAKSFNVIASDNDGDGVVSGLDADDNDASVAFASYFPSASVWGTYTFEDLWPVKGDYDVNDLVIGFKISYYTNSSNLVTKFRVDYNQMGAGSTYRLGAAFQLDKVPSSNVQSVSGRTIDVSSVFSIDPNGCESGVSLAVIPLLNSQQDYVSYSGYLNTVSGAHIDTPDQNVVVKFVTPFQQADIAMSSFNMFIVANTRGCEIHLPSYTATTKFNSLLATGYDLYNGDQFKNNDGMMWGIMIPELFEYPAECNSILKAYSHFAEWATSGGASNTDWYKPIAGNKNQDYIYQWQVAGAGPPTDFDGNIYPSVTIGTQVWLAQNLNTTHYNDGTAIPNITGTTAWAALTTGAYCNYSNNSANAVVYGKLYNWYAIDNNAATKTASNGGKNLCPVGWHVPNDTEWTTLITYLGGSYAAGGKLKETGTTHWLKPNKGATNLSGFTALPAGVRYPSNFQNLTGNGNFWSTTIYTRPQCRVLYSGNANMLPGSCEKIYGYSVRCIKD